ncbi:MAG: hypothetical protein EOO36_02475 [Cytophagaceae bacterium]|nr:MAG: hypothetical protein EOO36_02475 [Cytophagaceae bacterium]
MQSHPHSPSKSALATSSSAPGLPAAPCPTLAAIKARAKSLKKWRKQEHLRFFSGWCASLHALGFSF